MSFHQFATSKTEKYKKIPTEVGHSVSEHNNTNELHTSEMPCIAEI